MFEFAWPWVFAMLPLPILVWWLLPPYRARQASVQVPFFERLASATGQTPQRGAVVLRRRATQMIVAVLIWLLIVAALARPQWVGDPVTREVSARDLVLAIDISGSMDQRDFKATDGTTLTREPFNGAGGSLMVLPSGEILVGGFAVYASTGTYNASWAPTISSAPSSVTRGQSYQIAGTQFNGLNQGAAFGDELDTHTNYPLVRITNTATGHVFYARTHDHSSMGVATGSATITTNFDVTSATETGASTLVVVANGIPSAPVNVTVN